LLFRPPADYHLALAIDQQLRVPRVFVSYSHGDGDFVQPLADRLRLKGLQVWIDNADLAAGDSLVERIGDAIRDGDFLVAVISPSSVESPWCQKELRLAATRGINESRVFVLPVRRGGAAMPSYLMDAFYLEGDKPRDVADEVFQSIEAHVARLRQQGGAPAAMDNVVMPQDALLQLLGVDDFANEDERKFVFETMMVTIMDRVMPRVIELLDEDQLEQLDAIMNDDLDEYEFLRWLQANVSALPFIWREEAGRIRDEYATFAEQERRASSE